MSETSEDKTKRKYLAMLTDHHWSHQYSVFYDDLALSKHLLADMVGFKQALRKEFPSQPFLIRIQTKVGNGRGDKTLQAYLMILTTARSEGLKKVAGNTFSSQVNVMSDMKLAPEKLKSIASAIDVQKPHDLSKVFGDVRIRRWSVLNKETLVIRE